jgi:hypothetical protein
VKREPGVALLGISPANHLLFVALLIPSFDSHHTSQSIHSQRTTAVRISTRSATQVLNKGKKSESKHKGTPPNPEPWFQKHQSFIVLATAKTEAEVYK